MYSARIKYCVPNFKLCPQFQTFCQRGQNSSPSKPSGLFGQALRPSVPLFIAVVFLLNAVFFHGLAHSQEPAGAQPIAIRAEPVRFSRVRPARIRFGKLAWRGGMVLHSSDKRFGGFSGLQIAGDGKRIVAVSDRGWWLGAELEYRHGKLAGISAATMATILNKQAERAKGKANRDAEALAAFDMKTIDGLVLVGFERRERMELFNIGADGFAATPIEIEIPKEIASGRNNSELESIARLWQGPFAGWYIAISGRNLDKRGNIRGWRWKFSETVEFAIRRHDNHLITDMAVLPGGEEIVTLERSFSTGNLPGIALRLFRVRDFRPRQPAAGRLLFAGRWPAVQIDNMEGLAVHRTSDGETRLTMISDDNYNRAVQRTLLYQFALRR